MASIASGDKRRRASASADRTAPLRSGSSRQTPLQATPGSPETAPSPPRALQRAQRYPSEKKKCRIERPSLQMAAFLTTNEPALVKTASICKSSFRSAGDRPAAVPTTRRLCRPGQSGPTNSLAQVERPDNPGQTARRPSIQIERFASSARTARQLKSTSS